MNPLDKLGGRKFVLSIISLVAGVAASSLSVKGLTPELVGLIVGVLATFSGTNVMVSKAAMQTSSSDAAAPVTETEQQVALPAPAVDQSEIIERLDRIEQTVGQVAVSASNTNKLLASAMAAGSSR